MGRASSPARRLLFLTSACEAPDPTHRSRQLKQAQRKHCCIYFALHAERHCRGKLAHVGHRSTDARQLAFAPEAPARPSPRCSLSELQCTPTEDSQLDVGKDESMCRLFVQVWTHRAGAKKYMAILETQRARHPWQRRLATRQGEGEAKRKLVAVNVCVWVCVGLGGEQRVEWSCKRVGACALCKALGLSEARG